MQVIGFTEPGGPDVLTLHQLADPVAGPGEVVIDVRAAAVSPTDTLRRSGLRALSGDGPHVPGMDVAGVVAAIGDGTITDLHIGEEVMGFVVPSGSHGGYSEKIALSADSVARVPAGTSLAEASTLPMNGLTARLALDTLDLPEGSTIAVTGAAGTLGGYTVQLAKADGYRAIADASEADHDLVTSLGPDLVLPRGAGYAEAIRAEVPEGVAAVVDAAQQLEEIVPAVQDNGTVITIRGDEGERDRGVMLQPIVVVAYDREQAKLEELRQQVERGELTLRVADRLPKEQAPEAHRRLEAGGVRGRLVLEF